MPRYSREQVRRRRRTALGCLTLVVLLVFASCTTVLVRAVSGAGGGAASTAEGDDDVLSLPSTPQDAPIRSQLPKGVPVSSEQAIGIDVSGHQEDIDWQAAREDGVSFAYIKATEGSGFVDPQYSSHHDGARAAGITVGAYHYFTLCSSGADQAKDFLAAVTPADGDLPPALDLEFDGACDERPEAKHTQAEIEDFVAAVEKAWGRRVLVYASADWRSHYGLEVTEERPDWLFSEGHPPRAADWALWQVRFDATVAGVRGGVDLDVARIEILRDQAALEES